MGLHSDLRTTETFLKSKPDQTPPLLKTPQWLPTVRIDRVPTLWLPQLLSQALDHMPFLRALLSTSSIPPRCGCCFCLRSLYLPHVPGEPFLLLLPQRELGPPWPHSLICLYHSPDHAMWSLFCEPPPPSHSHSHRTGTDSGLPQSRCQINTYERRKGRKA